MNEEDKKWKAEMESKWQQILNKLHEQDARQFAVDRKVAYEASLPKDEDFVVVRQGKGLMAKNVGTQFKHIRNAAGLKYDDEQGVWRVDDFEATVPHKRIV